MNTRRAVGIAREPVPNPPRTAAPARSHGAPPAHSANAPNPDRWTDGPADRPPDDETAEGGPANNAAGRPETDNEKPPLRISPKRGFLRTNPTVDDDCPLCARGDLNPHVPKDTGT